MLLVGRDPYSQRFRLQLGLWLCCFPEPELVCIGCCVQHRLSGVDVEPELAFAGSAIHVRFHSGRVKCVSTIGELAMTVNGYTRSRPTDVVDEDRGVTCEHIVGVGGGDSEV